jgi:hypothetical protein
MERLPTSKMKNVLAREFRDYSGSGRAAPKRRATMTSLVAKAFGLLATWRLKLPSTICPNTDGKPPAFAGRH